MFTIRIIVPTKIPHPLNPIENLKMDDGKTNFSTVLRFTISFFNRLMLVLRQKTDTIHRLKDTLMTV